MEGGREHQLAPIGATRITRVEDRLDRIEERLGCIADSLTQVVQQASGSAVTELPRQDLQRKYSGGFGRKGRLHGLEDESKAYAVFLSHHKAASGMEARHFKNSLEESLGPVFLDSDDLNSK